MGVTVQGPDGNSYQFPDGTDKTAAIAYFKKKGIGAKPPSEAPLPEGVKQTGTNAKGQRIVAPEGQSFMGELGHELADPSTYTGAVKGAWNEAKSVPAGFASMFNPKMQPGENVATATPLARLLKSEYESRKQVTQQAADQFKRGETTRGVVSGLSSLMPLPAVPGMVAGINQQQDEGKGAESFGKAAVDSALLAGGGEKAVKVAKNLSRGTLDAMMGTGPRVVKDLVKKTTDLNEASAERTKGINERRAAADAERTKKVTVANEAAVRAHEDAAAKVDKENRDAHVKHLADKAEVENVNKGAEAIPDSRAGLETYVKDKTEAADVRTEKARHDALEVGNKQYNAVNEKLNPIPSDMAGPSTAYAKAANAYGDVLNQPPLLRLLGQLLEEPTEGETKAPVTYKDEQQLYSKLGNELSKGTLDGPTYHAYDIIHDAIGEDMQRIADLQGMGSELTKARAYWKRMKQTFGKSQETVSDRAGKAVAEANPEQDAAQREDYRHRLLGSFDPQIPELLKQASSARERLGKMPSEEQARGMLKSLPRAPEAVEPPPLQTSPVPKPRQPLKSIPKTIGPKEVQAAKTEGLEGREKFVNQRVMWVAVTPLLYTIDAIVRGMPTHPGDVAMGMGSMLTAGKLVTKLMENPTFADWITKATPRDVEALPPELRGSFPNVVKAAQAKGIKVSPALLGIAASNQPKKRVAAAMSP